MVFAAIFCLSVLHCEDIWHYNSRSIVKKKGRYTNSGQYFSAFVDERSQNFGT